MSQGDPPRPHHLWGRRDLLTAASWTAVGLSLTAGTAAFVRLLFRRAPIEAPTRFNAGRTGDYKPGNVSDRFVRDWRVFIVREEQTLFAVVARCTHLGCTPRWYSRDAKFKCPCHGSGFTRQGVNFEGPAPRPLERARIWLDADGLLWVDVGRRFRENAWQESGAFVTVGHKEQA